MYTYVCTCTCRDAPWEQEVHVHVSATPGHCIAMCNALPAMYRDAYGWLAIPCSYDFWPGTTLHHQSFYFLHLFGTFFYISTMYILTDRTKEVSCHF